MTRSPRRAITAIEHVGRMPYGLARTQAAEQEVRRIDAEGPVEVLAYALSTLVDSMFWAGEVEKSFVPFTRLVRWWDEHPEHFDEVDRHHVFWMFKWMVADVMEFPTVPATQIEATIADMAHRYTIAGHGMNAVMQQRFFWADERGSVDADAAFAAWCVTPRDEFSQCEACEPGDRVAYLVRSGRLAEAIELGEATLTLSLTCATEPADLLSHLQLAYLGTGRDADAASAHRRTVAQLARATGTMAGARGRLVMFLGRSGNDEAAVRRIEADQALLTGCDSPQEQLRYLLEVGSATHVMRLDGPGRAVTLTAVPATTVAELDDWVRTHAEALAAAFDRRNGTDAWARRVTAAWSSVRQGRVDLAVLRPDAATGEPVDRAATPAPAGRPHAATTDAGEALDPQVPGDPDDAAVLLARAASAERSGDLDAAAVAFLALSDAAERAGRTADAGWARADAARYALMLGDQPGAVAAFDRALALLEAADVAPEDAAPVACAYAAACAELGSPLDAIQRIDHLAAALDNLLAAPDDDVSPELAQRRRTARRRARADLIDVTARVRATAGEHAEAARGAQVAAEEMADLGLPADAAHAFWLAGRLHVALGEPDTAVWYLESAVEGFAIAPDAGNRAAAASELIAVLRSLGRDADADAVTA